MKRETSARVVIEGNPSEATLNHAGELTRRYNLHEELVDALGEFVGMCDEGGGELVDVMKLYNSYSNLLARAKQKGGGEGE